MNVRGGIVAAEDFVEGKHRAEVEVELLAELAIDLVHVAVELLEQALEAVEHGVERGLIAGKVGADEVFERGGVAVVGAPEFGDLMQAALQRGGAGDSPYLAITRSPVWRLEAFIQAGWMAAVACGLNWTSASPGRRAVGRDILRIAKVGARIPPWAEHTSIAAMRDQNASTTKATKAHKGKPALLTHIGFPS